MPIISRFYRILVHSCHFREAESNKQPVVTTWVSTRYGWGVLKNLHDMKRGC